MIFVVLAIGSLRSASLSHKKRPLVISMTASPCETGTSPARAAIV